jgi:membrane protein
MKVSAIFTLLRQAFDVWRAENAARLGAALAYYSVFSISPLMVLVLAAARHLFGDKAAQHVLADELESAVGAPLARAIEWLVANAGDERTTTTATIISIILLLFGASAVFGQLQDALNVIWKVPPPKGGAWLRLVFDRFLAFLMVLGTGVLLLAALIVSTTLQVLNKRLDAVIGPWGVAFWQGVNLVVLLLISTVLFAMIYKALPRVQLSWSDVSLGAAVTAVLFILGKYLISLYLAYGSVASGYGAAGSLVVVLVWVYYSSQVFLYGAAFTRVVAERRRGSLPPPA